MIKNVNLQQAQLMWAEQPAVGLKFRTELKTYDFLPLIVTLFLLFYFCSSCSRPSFGTAYIELLISDSRSVLLSNNIAVKSPRYCSGETRRNEYIL
jgi:hypothetical protein